MANTVIQIKRSSATSAPTNGSLAAAEPAYSFNSDKLFLGNTTGTGVVEVGGKFYVDMTQASYAQANAAYAAANSAGSSATVGAAFDQANTARTHANSAFAGANAALIQANTARDQANTAFTGANAAIIQANTARDHANTAFAGANAALIQANTARDHANTAHASANAALTQANTARTHANTAHETANAAIGQANTARTHANAAFEQANTARTHANSAFDQANTARTHANSAYAEANSKLSLSGGTITGNLAVTGSLTVSGNTYVIDAENLRVADPLIYLAGNNYTSDIVDIGFIGNYVNATGQNVHTGFYREHEDKMYYLFNGYDAEPANNHIGALSNNMVLAVLNADIRTSNLNLGGVNAITWITSSFNQANTARDHANTAHATGNAALVQANTARDHANASFTQANTARTHANTAHESANAALIQANTARTHANAAFDGANAALIQANTARTHANSAFDGANAALIQANTARDHANVSFAHANAAFLKANGAAYLAFGTVSAGGTSLVADSNNDTLTITSGNGIVLIADAGSDSFNIALSATGVTADTYGGADTVGRFTVDQWGRITSAGNSAIAISAAAITSGTLPVGRGGTGATTFTTNGVLFGQATSAIGVTAAGTEGQVLQASAAGVPGFGMLDGGTF